MLVNERSAFFVAELIVLALLPMLLGSVIPGYRDDRREAILRNPRLSSLAAASTALVLAAAAAALQLWTWVIFNLVFAICIPAAIYLVARREAGRSTSTDD